MQISGSVTMALGKIGDLTMSGLMLVEIFQLTVSIQFCYRPSVVILARAALPYLWRRVRPIVLADDVDVSKAGKDFTLDASNFGGDVSIGAMTGSGAATISMGGPGSFSAGNIAFGRSCV